MYENIVTAVATFFALFGAVIIFYGGLQAILRIVAPGTSIEEADKIADVVSARVMENGGCQSCTFHVEPDRG